MAPPFVFPSSLQDLEQGADGDDEPSLRPQNPVTVVALRAADLEEFVKALDMAGINKVTLVHAKLWS